MSPLMFSDEAQKHRHDVRVASEELAVELGQMGPQVLPRLAREYLELRDQCNDLDKRRESVRKQLMDLLEGNGGEYIDEVAGQRLYIDTQPRWEYNATLLHKLVEEHLLTDTEFAGCLRTVVDKDVVQGWLDRGLVTDRQVNMMNAKEGTKIVRSVKTAPIGGRR